MNGKDLRVRGKGERGSGARTDLRTFPLSPFPLTRRGARGFTLLELMIVISILVILALIAMGTYNRTVLVAPKSIRSVSCAAWPTTIGAELRYTVPLTFMDQNAAPPK